MHILKESSRFISARAVALQNLPQTFRGRERSKRGYAGHPLPAAPAAPAARTAAAPWASRRVGAGLGDTKHNVYSIAVTSGAYQRSSCSPWRLQWHHPCTQCRCRYCYWACLIPTYTDYSSSRPTRPSQYGNHHAPARIDKVWPPWWMKVSIGRETRRRGRGRR